MTNKKSKTKFKLNVDGKGTIFANSVFELFKKLITGQYIKNAYNNSGRPKRS
jgi:hypothetical protein